MSEVLAVQSAQGNYQVFFSEKIAASQSSLKNTRASHFIVDQQVYECHRENLASLMGERPLYLVEATEKTKTIEGVKALSSWLQSQGANRASSLVAIGGGITQDLVTFTAHVYYRGIPWIFYPTTLLSMCDSSIGAKCGINLNEFKNQLGVFHSPSAVFTCLEFLNTLPEFQLSSGYGEILKLHLTGSSWEPFFALRSAVETGLRNEKLLDLIKTSLTIKKGIIECDEFETDLRRVLNYGHTFGHALESVTEHEVPHGLAVAWGIDLINFIAVQRGFLSAKKGQTIREFIKQYLPHEIKVAVSAQQLIEKAKKDKKADQTGIHLVFLMESGCLEIKKVLLDQQLLAEVSRYLEDGNVYASY